MFCPSYCGWGCAQLVCLAWWQALSSKDTVSKIVSVWWPVFAFTAIGFEHSIANMFCARTKLPTATAAHRCGAVTGPCRSIT